MAVVFSDTFTAANGTTLQAHDATWVKNTADAPVDLIILSGRVALSSGSSVSTYINTASGALTDQLVEADIVAASGTGGIHGVVARSSATQREYYLARWNAGVLQLYRFDAGSTNKLVASDASAPMTTGQTHKIGLRCVGNQISVVWDGVTKIGPVTDSTYTLGYPGVRVLTDASRSMSIDNFSVDNLAAADTTAPTLTSPSATATGATTASGSVTTNEANGTLYYLASANATELAATVKAGSSQAVTASGVQNVTVTGLTASTSYYLHFVHTDASANDSAVATSGQFTTSAAGDTTVPTLTGSVTFASITQTSYTAQWPAGSDNVAVTGYEYQIGGTGGAWTDAGNNLSAAITGRTAGTTETVYVRAYDAAGLRSTPAISGEVTLLSVVAGINVTEPLKNNTGTVLASQSGVRVAVLQAADLVSVYETTGLTTNASGMLAPISNAAIITGQQYHVAIKLADGSVGITGPITAS